MHSPDCLLEEICLGCRADGRHDLLQIEPLAPSGHSGSAHGAGGSGGEGVGPDPSISAAHQLRTFHRLVMLTVGGRGLEALDDFPAAITAPALREAVAAYPDRLLCLERSPPDFGVRPGLISLMRHAPVA